MLIVVTISFLRFVAFKKIGCGCTIHYTLLLVLEPKLFILRLIKYFNKKCKICLKDNYDKNRYVQSLEVDLNFEHLH